MEFILDEGVLRRVRENENIETFTGRIYEIDDTEVIRIPDGTKEIQFNSEIRFMFEMFCCKNTKKVIIPKGLEIIGEASFYEWEKLEEVYLPDSLKEIKPFAFYKTAIKKTVIPENVEVIHSYAFGDCTELEEFVFPKSSTFIFSDLLNGCKKLKSIDIPLYLKSMLELSESGFESIDVPEGIESITPSAFDKCENLKHVTLPSTLKKEKIYAFGDCIALESITFKKYLKPFTIMLSELPALKRLNVPAKDASKAKVDFPKLIIGDLDGNIIYNSDDTVSEKDKPREKKTGKKQKDPMDDTKLHNRSMDIEQNGKVFHIDIKGTGAITRTVNKYIKAAKEGEGTFFNPEELVCLNSNYLFENEKHTGILIHTLGQDRSACMLPGRYSAPISPEEAIKRANDFQSKALKCLSNEKIELILSKVPHKKNGTLHKKRTTCILKLNCVDEDAMMCMIYAKNLDDMALEINVKQFYVGDDISQDNELSVEIL